MKHIVLDYRTIADLAQEEAALKFCIEKLHSFEPMEIRNSLPIALGLLKAKELGCKIVATGDGADELFAGFVISRTFDRPRSRRNLIDVPQLQIHAKYV
jgi:asparagine synthetase B (glutamine-hydrolysing)